MKVEIKVPQIGESVTEGVVANILIPSGSVVQKDAEIMEIETDKVNQTIYAPESGELKLVVETESTVHVGQIIGVVDTDVKGEVPQAPAPAEEAPAQEESPKEEAPAPESSPERTTPIITEKIRSSELSHLDEIQSSEPAPIVDETPKQEEAPAPKEADEPVRKKMSALRRTIAKKLVDVKNETAMLTTFNEVDMSKVIDIRLKKKESFEQAHGVKLGFMSFFVKAVVSALQAFPAVNSYIDGDDIVSFSNFHIGVAVSTDKGLMVPVIFDADKLSYADIEKKLKEYALSAREGRISIDELSGGTFTITNGGVFGSLLSTPILNPPQSAILGMHTIQKRPIEVDGEVAIRPMMYLALSYDHRVIDGKEAVSFLVHIKKSLEDPTRLLLGF